MPTCPMRPRSLLKWRNDPNCRRGGSVIGTCLPYTGDEADNPNSFERQHSALLEFCRRMKRVVSEQEALDYIKANSLFTGRWGDNIARRGQE